MNENLLRTLRSLRLSGLAASLDVRLQEASANRLAHLEFLELLLQDELLVRDQRRVGRRLKNAAFANLKTLDEFNWQFNPAIDRRRFDELATCRFVREHRDLLLIGPPGVGKSHLAQALGYRAVQSGFTVLYRSIFDLVRDFLQDEALAGQRKALAAFLRPDLLIIDDMGMKQLPRNSGEYLFEVIMRRYETRSTVMTSNRPIEDWGKLIGDVPAAGAILDRFLHHAEVIPIEGRSYRLGNRMAKEDLKTHSEEVESPRESGGF
jgi:DNA replication protein DnaC